MMALMSKIQSKLRNKCNLNANSVPNMKSVITFTFIKKYSKFNITISTKQNFKSIIEVLYANLLAQILSNHARPRLELIAKSSCVFCSLAPSLADFWPRSTHCAPTKLQCDYCMHIYEFAIY